MGAYLLFDGGAIHFDVVRSDTVTLAASVTEHPVEQGADIADHIRPELIKVRLEVFVSNSPVDDVNGYGQTQQTFRAKVREQPQPNPLDALKSGNVVGAIGAAVNSATSAIASAIGLDDGLPHDFDVKGWSFKGNVPDGFDFVKDMVAQLEVLKDTPTLVDVVTHARYCAGMAITSIVPSQHNDGSYITIDFKAVRFVTTSSVDAPKPIMPMSNPKKAAGIQEPTAPDQSILAGLVDLAGMGASLPPAAP